MPYHTNCSSILRMTGLYSYMSYQDLLAEQEALKAFSLQQSKEPVQMQTCPVSLEYVPCASAFDSQSVILCSLLLLT